MERVSLLKKLVDAVVRWFSPSKHADEVKAELDALAKKSDAKDWRHSIVDLMKLTGLKADLKSRKALAEELGEPKYEGTTKQNAWLHEQVMKEIAKRGVDLSK
jgi:hypothetical protein